MSRITEPVIEFVLGVCDPILDRISDVLRKFELGNCLTQLTSLTLSKESYKKKLS